jgi:hypothetical protein
MTIYDHTLRLKDGLPPNFKDSHVQGVKAQVIHMNKIYKVLAEQVATAGKY